MEILGEEYFSGRRDTHLIGRCGRDSNTLVTIQMPANNDKPVLLDTLGAPIVLAPLAGGPSTPELAAAVSEAGGLGFLAAGYLSADALGERIERTRALTERP